MNLSHLGDQLRDETYRNEIYTQLPTLILELTTSLSSNPMDSLRCLINLTADNDRNREAIVSSKIWPAINDLIDSDVSERLAMFLLQFIHTEDANKQKWLPVIYRNLPQLAKTVLASVASHEGYLEFIKETETVAQVVEDIPQWIAKVSEAISTQDDEIMVNYTDIILRATLLDDSTSLDKLSPVVIREIERIPTSSENYAAVARKLFASSGNLTSMPSYNVGAELDEAIAGVESSKNPYSQAAWAITIGNYITSAERASDVWTKINNPRYFLDRYFSIAMNDVVQLQAVHMMTNLVTADYVEEVVTKYRDTIDKWYQISVANKQYYPEISSLVNKLIRKLIRVGNSDTTANLLSMVDDKHTKLALLESMIQSNQPVSAKLAKECFTWDDGKISIELALEQIKMAGMVLFKAKSSNVDVNIPLLTQFLQKLAEFLPSASTHPLYNVLSNNSRFVAANAVSYDGEVKDLALKILKENE